MKASGLLLLALVNIGLAAPTVTLDITAPSLRVVDATSNTNNTFTVQGYGGKNEYYRYSFDLWYEEYCGAGSDHGSDHLVMARAELSTSYEGHTEWDFERDTAAIVILDDSNGESIAIFHDYINSQIQLTYEDCNWKDYERKNCGWCNQPPWQGDSASGVDCNSDNGLTRHRKIHCTFQRKRKPKSMASISPIPRQPELLSPTRDEDAVGERSELSLSVSLATAGEASSVNSSIHTSAPNYKISTQSHDMKQHSFEVFIEEYCNIDTRTAPYKESLHVDAVFFYEKNLEYAWDARMGSAEAFPLGDAGGALLVRHDHTTSETHFEYEDCKWKDNERKNCGWCEQSVSWEGPGADSRLDCANHPELYRRRKITCTLVRNTEVPVLVLRPGEDWKGTTAHDDPLLTASMADGHIVTARDALNTPSRSISENLYRFSISFSEYCESGVLKARGWLGNGEVNFQLTLNPTQVTKIGLHPEYEMVFGPYSFESNSFGIEYDRCKWSPEGGYPCGWCEPQAWTLGPLNCQTGQPGNQRLTWRTCYFVDNHMNEQTGSGGDETTTSTPVMEVFEAVSPRDEPYLVPSTSGTRVDLALDVPIEAPVYVPEDQFAWYRFNISFSESCNDNTLTTQGWWSDDKQSYEVVLNTNTWTHVGLHPPTPNKADTLVIGPYSSAQQYLDFQYGDCKFNNKGGSQCGYCISQPWTLGPLDCATGAPGSQRFTYTTCYMKDNINRQVVARDFQVETVTPTPIEDMTFEVASSTVTPAPAFSGALQISASNGEMFGVQASTVVLMPAIIETTVPNAPQAQKDVILPFHFHIWEYCLNGQRLAAGIYTNGNMKQKISLTPGLMISINHRVPGYANLDVGPFDYSTSRARFRYLRNERTVSENCDWFDDQTWKSCGECRAGLWSAGPLDCANPRSVRYKDMNCSVLLGKKKASTG